MVFCFIYFVLLGSWEDGVLDSGDVDGLRGSHDLMVDTCMACQGWDV